MKIYTAILVFSLQMIFTLTKAQLPQTNDTAIHVSLVMPVKPNAVRIVKNKIDNAFYYGTFSGGIYKIIKNGTTYYDTLIANAGNHNINYLQGMAFHDSILYLVGNRKIPNSAGYGLVVRGKFMNGTTWTWDTLLRTDAYPSTATLYDHAFSSICVSVGGDSLYIGSGARTDHGEVQTSGGLFPNTREVPLTTLILRIPINPLQTIYLPNDSATLATSPYIYCRGVRNTFDMALAPNNDLLGSENSGDRDDPEELNWLRLNKHYGFPWRMGGNATPMQFPNYNPANDKLINHNSLAWTNGYFYNDLTYPAPTPSLTFTEPIKNFGPDADKFRDTLTGSTRDASNEGTFITSFTSHRSPLGLVFDTPGKLAAPYYKSGFLMSYTEGTLDSSGTLPNGTTGPFSDLGQDLLQLALFKDTATGQYTMNCYRIAWNFKSPVDAYLDDNTLYIIESHYPANIVAPNLYAITFPVNTKTGSSYFLPKDTSICAGSTITITPNVKGQYRYLWSNGATTSQITVSPSVTTSYSLKIYNGITLTQDTILVSIASNPIMAGAISGLTKPCPGSFGLIYSVAAVNGVTYYTWTVPTGVKISSGQGTRTITVNVGSTFVSGLITVTTGNSCGISAPRTKSISRNIPGVPSTIIGQVYGICGGLTVNYSINAMTTATNYLWTVPSGVVINSGQGTTSINATFPTFFTTGTISVKAGNTCGYGNPRNLTVRGTPAVPPVITGPSTVCSNQTGVNYITPAVQGATSYNWTVPTGSIITSGQGSVSVMVTFGITAGNVRVRSANSCGASSYKNLAVSINCRNGDEGKQQNVFIYPNPGYNHFTITVESETGNYRLNIYDPSGKLVEEWKDLDTNQPFEFGQSLSEGIYFAEILLGDQRKMMKLIKIE